MTDDNQEQQTEDTPQENTQPQADTDQQRQKVEKRHSKTIPSPARTSDPGAVIKNPIDEPDDTFKQLLKLTGIKKAHVIGYNSTSRTIVTEQGGKYQLKASGKSFRRLSGPLAPAEKREAEEDE